ncbi:MAG: biopolymer transporter ExbD [Candidatus Symbiothrix sp.]|jgi:biopolymer transport protein ExbD|nr:biopolymer transporter ExbD [Candidatus Symbiothrix sp.]
MSRFRKSANRQVPGLNTAALPDLVFTLLFFFMIVTSMQTVPVMTQLDLPVTEEMQKLQEKSLLVYIMVGKDLHQIQFNSGFIALDDLPAHLQSFKTELPEADRGKLTAILKIDKDTQMSVVHKIKESLRGAGVLTVHYSVVKNSRR